jgi:kumamolisin
VEVPGSRREPVAGARRAGRALRDAPVEVTLVLRRRPDVEPFPPVGEFGGDRRRPRPFLTPDEFAVRYGAAEEDLDGVRRFAARQGLTVVGERVGPRLVRLRGPSAAMEAAFQVHLERWVHASGSYRGRTGSVQVPDDLAPSIVAVLGLDNRPQARSHVRRRRQASGGDVSYSPPQVASAYDFPAGTTGVGQTIALVELGGGYASADLTSFFGGLGLAVPSVTAVSVDGATNAPTGSPDGPDAEVELDIEVAGSAAPGAALVAYFAPNTDDGFLDALSSAIHATAPASNVVSVSWGGPESSWTDQARASMDAVLLDAAALGVTVVVASGDQGASDGSSDGLAVDFPASDPNVLGCGGTTLRLNGGVIVSETVWNDLASGEGATGGGVSIDFAEPAYQSDADVPPAPGGGTGRGVPDVAASADPAAGYAVVVDGTAVVLGGTSAAAPLWAALVARINAALGRPLGFLNPLLYPTPVSSTLHDITVGNNDGYAAGPGWSACTGWGSPDGARLLAALRATLG